MSHSLNPGLVPWLAVAVVGLGAGAGGDLEERRVFRRVSPGRFPVYHCASSTAACASVAPDSDAHGARRRAYLHCQSGRVTTTLRSRRRPMSTPATMTCGKAAPYSPRFTRSRRAVRNCETAGSWQQTEPRLTAKNKTLTCGGGGALGGTRTPNLLIRSQMLYPLSYERQMAQLVYGTAQAGWPGSAGCEGQPGAMSTNRL
jgi:hypothetical protein